MAYVIKRTETVETALKRIAREQIDRALEETADPTMDRHDAVHQSRKRCKKIRALLRLVRPVFEGSYAEENVWYRDAARELAWVRDAQSVLDTHLALVARYRHHLDRQAAAQVSVWLTERRDRAAEDGQTLTDAIDRLRERLVDGRGRIWSWSLRRHDFRAVEGGLVKTYSRGRRAMAAAYRCPTTENFHEWRKCVKYHWYHLRLLQKLHPPLLKAQRDQAGRLGELLGQEHDLALLRQLLADAGDAALDPGAAQALMALAERQRERLRRQARGPGALLYCEKPKRLAARIGCYWDLRAG